MGKQAKEALRKTDALQRAIFSSANFSSIATDAQGIIQIFNVGAERMLGYAAAEVTNRITPADISDPDEVIARAKVLSAELETSIAPGLEALIFKASRGIEDIYELTYLRKDGSRLPAVVSVTALRDAQEKIIGYLLIGTDNTARKQAEEALRDQGALQRAIFSSANFSSIATDAQGVIQIFNVGAERMLGYAAAEVMNRITPADISDPDEVIARAKALGVEFGTLIAPGFEALIFKASRGIEDIYELTYVRKDGSRFPAVVSVTALRDAQEKIIGYLLIGTDNTARKQIEKDRARAAQLQAASHAKDLFLSSMSHELRTPLNVILGFAQLLEAEIGDCAQRSESIEQIQKAGWHLLELINEVLDLSKIEAGEIRLSMESVELRDVVTEILQLIGPVASKRQIVIAAQAIQTCTSHIWVDRTRLRQVLLNLLTNAVKYNRIGGSVMLAIGVSASDKVRIEVTDTGPGLTPLQQAHLFEAFNRLGRENETVEGTGIGLVITRRLVEAMGGTIGVTSVAGEGSTFWIEFATAATSTTVIPLHQPARSDAVAAPTRICKLLCVEDNPVNLLLVAKIVATQPRLIMLSANTGARGLEIARAQCPDIILLDIELPDMNGLEVLRQLQLDTRTKDIPVLAFSAHAARQSMAQALAAGFRHYITKPIRVKEFLDTIYRTLNK